MLATFDPMKVNVSFNNRQLRMFGESMFTLARDEANVTLKKGVKGDSTYILNANKAGKLTITLLQDSPDVAYLEQCAEKNVMANLAITDANDSGSVFSLRTAWWRSCLTGREARRPLMSPSCSSSLTSSCNG